MDGNSNDFQVVKSYIVHFTRLTEVQCQLVLIKGEPYIGLHRQRALNEDELEPEKLRHKSILIPLEAWNAVIRQASPGLVKAAEQISEAKTPSKESTNSILNHLTRAPKKVQPALTRAENQAATLNPYARNFAPYPGIPITYQELAQHPRWDPHVFYPEVAPKPTQTTCSANPNGM